MRLLKLLFTAVIVFSPSWSVRAQEMCRDLLLVQAQLSPQKSLIDLASRLSEVSLKFTGLGYIPTHQLGYLKAMALEADVLHQYFTKLYTQTYPDLSWIAREFEERREFLEAVNTYVSSVAMYRDFERWLVDSQHEALRDDRTVDAAKVYQLVRDELNLVYYPRLTELHAHLTGAKPFFYDEPFTWAHWFKDYVTFLEGLPEAPLPAQKTLLLNHLTAEFGQLHQEVQQIRPDEMEGRELSAVEQRVHDLRRKIRAINIVLLKSSNLILLEDREPDGEDIPPEVILAAGSSTDRSSRYLTLQAPLANPLHFPKVSFYAIHHFTLELGRIKDRLERTLFFQTLTPTLQKEQARSQNPERAKRLEQAVEWLRLQDQQENLASSAALQIKSLQRSQLFLYTASQLTEAHLNDDFGASSK